MSTSTPLCPSRLHHLPMGHAFGVTDIGPVRNNNEDNFLIDEALGLVMVADGMGGHAAGDVASAAVLNALRGHLRAHAARDAAVIGERTQELHAPDPDATWSDPTMRAVGLLHDAIDAANRDLYAQNRARTCRDGEGMGATLTGFWRPGADAPLTLFHVGDSRLYRLRAGRLEQLTRDQTLYQQAVDAGVLRDLPARNVLLQAMGPAPRVAPEVRTQLTEPGDLLMLCSDGLHGSVPHGDIEAELAQATAQTLEAHCRRLVAMAKDCGGRDNITVVLAFYEG
ncbi:MAG: protein phosphatase 2C domain-containing protein [Telluria sp.]